MDILCRRSFNRVFNIKIEMDAKQLYDYLAANYENHYFGSYEELNLILDNAEFPCVVVVPVSKTVLFQADQFKITERVDVAVLNKMELEEEMIVIYEEMQTLEKNLLNAIYPLSDKIKNIVCLSELNKFDANVLFSAFSLDVQHDSICN